MARFFRDRPDWQSYWRPRRLCEDPLSGVLLTFDSRILAFSVRPLLAGSSRTMLRQKAATQYNAVVPPASRGIDCGIQRSRQ